MCRKNGNESLSFIKRDVIEQGDHRQELENEKVQQFTQNVVGNCGQDRYPGVQKGPINKTTRSLVPPNCGHIFSQFLITLSVKRLSALPKRHPITIHAPKRVVLTHLDVFWTVPEFQHQMAIFVRFSCLLECAINLPGFKGFPQCLMSPFETAFHSYYCISHTNSIRTAKYLSSGFVRYFGLGVISLLGNRKFRLIIFTFPSFQYSIY